MSNEQGLAPAGLPRKTKILGCKTIQDGLRLAAQDKDTVFFVDLLVSKGEMEWIMKHKNNANYRPLSLSKAKEYAMLIDKLLFSWSPDGLAFDASGMLQNGQHRGHAQIMAERNDPLPYHITFNTPIGVTPTFDNGKNRTYADFIRARFGVANATEVGPLVKRLHFGWGMSMPRLYNMELEHLFPVYRDGIEFVMEQYTEFLEELSEKQLQETIAAGNKAFKRKAKIVGVTSATVKSVFARAYFSRPEKLNEISGFIHGLILGDSGSNSGKEDWIPILRKFLSNADTAGATNQLDLYSKTERALGDYLRDLPPGARLLAVSEEQFPFPPEMQQKIDNIGLDLNGRESE